jgi:hypothetical protein
MRRIDSPTLAGATLDRSYHVCAFFDSRDDEYQVLAPFYREGIEWGEKAVHIVDPALRLDHRHRLRQDFPTVTDGVTLRAAASVAGSALHTARLLDETARALRAKDEFLATRHRHPS